jgi:hypothetical protein
MNFESCFGGALRSSSHAGHDGWSHAGVYLVRDPVSLQHLRAVVEAAGLTLDDEQPEGVSRLFDETITGFSVGRGHPRARSKCRQRSLKPPSKSSER